jgi:hypothetical protein
MILSQTMVTVTSVSYKRQPLVPVQLIYRHWGTARFVGTAIEIYAFTVSPKLPYISNCNLVDLTMLTNLVVYIQTRSSPCSILNCPSTSSPSETNNLFALDFLTLACVWDLRFSSSSLPFPFVPLQRRGCLVAPLFLRIVLVPCAGD